MNLRFTYKGLPSRVLFAQLEAPLLRSELARLGVQRAMVLCAARQHALGERIVGMLGDRAAGLFSGAVLHTPVHVTALAVARLQCCGADGLLAIGGGSTIGLAKAVALRTGLPQLAIPTTYSGAEMTPILGETVNGRQTRRSTPKVLPQTVLYDTALTLALPPMLSASSGLNAIAHSAEALYARDGNPVISLMAEEGISALRHALPLIVKQPLHWEARAQAQYGAWLCGMALGSVDMGLHHKLCQVLGSAFDLPHAETHALLLPHSIAYNAKAAPEAMVRLARALGAADPVRGLEQLGRTLGIPASLAALGMPASGIERAADLATHQPCANPRPVEREAVCALLARAWLGQSATTSTTEAHALSLKA